MVLYVLRVDGVRAGMQPFLVCADRGSPRARGRRAAATDQWRQAQVKALIAATACGWLLIAGRVLRLHLTTMAEESYAEETRATARTLVLKGHSDPVACLAALDGGRLASGSWDNSVVIWNLADGTQLAKLEGHRRAVWSLAALDGGRLASGSWDNSVIIWSFDDGKKLFKLQGHTRPVWSLVALDGGRLASGGGDASIIIWNLADGTQLAKLEGHTSYVQCLAVLDGDRLASGGRDRSIIIWSLAEGTRLSTLEGHTSAVLSLAVLADGRLASGGGDSSIILWNPADGAQLGKLEGHTGSVQCLTTLDGDRLASGGDDISIIIWNLSDGTQLTKHEGHTAMVRCLATLDGNNLASGGSDELVRVRPVLHSAAYKFTACAAPFEYEEIARSCRKQGCLGDLVDASAVQQFDEHIGGLSASASVARQAHVFDALAKVANEDADPSEMIDSLAPSVLSLVRDDALLPDMYRRGVSNAAIQELAPSLFRVVLDAKFAAGPKFVLYFELVIFIVLGLCFTRVAPYQVFARGEKWFPSEKIVEIVVAFVVLAYFSVRELYQMAFTRAIELESSEEHLVDDLEGFRIASYVADAIVVPLHLVACCLGKQDQFEDWSEKAIREPIRYDALTFLGLSRAWRYDYWNWIDLATISCAWAAFARAAMPGARLSPDLAVATSMLMWVRFCWYLKNMRLGWAKFVLMFEDIIWDLRYYLFYFLVVLLMFASAFYLYLGPRKSDEFGFHDGHNAFRTFPYTVYNLILLGFVGDFDPDNFDEVAVRVLLVFFILVVMIVFVARVEIRFHGAPRHRRDNESDSPADLHTGFLTS